MTFEYDTPFKLKVRLRDRYEEPARRFNITSCQFSIHYAFETHDKASMMLRNACENLHSGGYFVGTTVDSNELMLEIVILICIPLSFLPPPVVECVDTEQ